MTVRRSVTAGPGGVYDLGYHVVWCPKYRRPVLVDEVAERLEDLLREKAAEHGWSFVSLQVMPDHVHAFIRCAPADSPAYVAQQLKGYTSRVLRAEFPALKRRLPTLWSRSFFVATVGAVSAETVQKYIDTQWERPWRKDGAAPLPAGEAGEVL
jgi:putative transposase